MSPRFLAAVRRLLELEGTYSDDPLDRGGPTLYGISKRAHPDVNFEKMTREDAAEIYYREYWKPLHLDMLWDPRLASLLFIFGVNASPLRASRALQKAVNDVGHPLPIDGKIGPVTLAAANSCPPRALRAELLREIREFYASLIEEDPTQRRFEKGWKNRYAEFEEP